MTVFRRPLRCSEPWSHLLAGLHHALLQLYSDMSSEDCFSIRFVNTLCALRMPHVSLNEVLFLVC
jgi:hypothetical protein